ncbi:MAG: deoxyribonuclease IV [Elusimicrobia bacterium]|nr:deoxyribonuclease IV [Candidatus Liberimonas magnetica]
MIRFGVHCSLRDGLAGALLEAKEKGCEAIQIFTRSPRMWKMRPAKAREIIEFKKTRKELNIFPVVVHSPYLPNLGTSNKWLYAKSTELLKEDMALSEKLGADYIVIHPGSYSENSNVKKGIANITRALNEALDEVPGKLVVLLENVAGGGRRLGSSFVELKQIIRGIKAKGRIAVCFDTAHAFGAGYDISNPAGIARTIKDFDTMIGIDRLKVIHFNDSLVPLSSRKDRHQHIGKGFIGLSGFKYIIRSLKEKVEAGILETPKEPVGSDKKNLRLLFGFRKN